MPRGEKTEETSSDGKEVLTVYLHSSLSPGLTSGQGGSSSRYPASHLSVTVNDTQQSPSSFRQRGEDSPTIPGHHPISQAISPPGDTATNHIETGAGKSPVQYPDIRSLARRHRAVLPVSEASSSSRGAQGSQPGDQTSEHQRQSPPVSFAGGQGPVRSSGQSTSSSTSLGPTLQPRSPVSSDDPRRWGIVGAGGSSSNVESGILILPHRPIGRVADHPGPATVPSRLPDEQSDGQRTEFEISDEEGETETGPRSGDDDEEGASEDEDQSSSCSGEEDSGPRTVSPQSDVASYSGSEDDEVRSGMLTQGRQERAEAALKRVLGAK